MDLIGKAIWSSIGMLFAIFTLVFGVIEVMAVGSDAAIMFILMAAISAVFIVFIADGCKRRLWKEAEDAQTQQETNEKE